MFNYIKEKLTGIARYMVGLCEAAYAKVSSFIEGIINGDILTGIIKTSGILILGSLLVSLAPLSVISALAFTFIFIMTVGYKQTVKSTVIDLDEKRKQRKQRSYVKASA